MRAAILALTALTLTACGGPVQRAEEHAARGDLRGALRVLDEAARIDPNDGLVLSKREALREALTGQSLEAAERALPRVERACEHARQAAQDGASPARVEAITRRIGEVAYAQAQPLLDQPAEAYQRAHALASCPDPKEHMERLQGLISAHLSREARAAAAQRRFRDAYALLGHITREDPKRAHSSEALIEALRGEERAWRLERAQAAARAGREGEALVERAAAIALGAEDLEAPTRARLSELRSAARLPLNIQIRGGQGLMDALPSGLIGSFSMGARRPADFSFTLHPGRCERAREMEEGRQPYVAGHRTVANPEATRLGEEVAQARAVMQEADKRALRLEERQARATKARDRYAARRYQPAAERFEAARARLRSLEAILREAQAAEAEARRRNAAAVSFAQNLVRARGQVRKHYGLEINADPQRVDWGFVADHQRGVERCKFWGRREVEGALSDLERQGRRVDSAMKERVARAREARIALRGLMEAERCLPRCTPDWIKAQQAFASAAPRLVAQQAEEVRRRSSAMRAIDQLNMSWSRVEQENARRQRRIAQGRSSLTPPSTGARPRASAGPSRPAQPSKPPLVAPRLSPQREAATRRVRASDQPRLRRAEIPRKPSGVLVPQKPRRVNDLQRTREVERSQRRAQQRAAQEREAQQRRRREQQRAAQEREAQQRRRREQQRAAQEREAQQRRRREQQRAAQEREAQQRRRAAQEREAARKREAQRHKAEQQRQLEQRKAEQRKAELRRRIEEKRKAEKKRKAEQKREAERRRRERAKKRSTRSSGKTAPSRCLVSRLREDFQRGSAPATQTLLPMPNQGDPAALLRANEQLASLLAEGVPHTVAIPPLIEASRRARAARDEASRRAKALGAKLAQLEEEARRLERDAEQATGQARAARQEADDRYRHYEREHQRLSQIPATVQEPIQRVLTYPIHHWRLLCEARVDESEGRRFIGRVEAEDRAHAAYPHAGLAEDLLELRDEPSRVEAESRSRAAAAEWLGAQLEAQRARVLAEALTLPQSRKLDALLGLALNAPEWAAAREALMAHLEAHHQMDLAPLLALVQPR